MKGIYMDYSDRVALYAVSYDTIQDLDELEALSVGEGRPYIPEAMLVCDGSRSLARFHRYGIGSGLPCPHC